MAQERSYAATVIFELLWMRMSLFLPLSTVAEAMPPSGPRHRLDHRRRKDHGHHQLHLQDVHLRQPHRRRPLHECADYRSLLSYIWSHP